MSASSLPTAWQICTLLDKIAQSLKNIIAVAGCRWPLFVSSNADSAKLYGAVPFL